MHLGGRTTCQGANQLNKKKNLEVSNFYFYQKKITGASRVAAKLKAAWASPSLAAPSPKQQMTQFPVPARFTAYAYPDAENKF